MKFAKWILITTQHSIGSPAIAFFGIALVVLASSCGQSGASNTARTGLPSAPSAVSATAGAASATVSWTAPSANGSSITRYTVTWSGGSQSCSQSPCLASGLTVGSTYTFTVTATNSVGTGRASAPSNSVTPTPVPAPPAGGPVPAQLLGSWFLSPAELNVAAGCPLPLNGKTCSLDLTLMSTTYRFQGTVGIPGPGDVVVNKHEIDFYNAPCGPGVGRYGWTLTGGVLHLTPLNYDPCGRVIYLANESFSRTL